jgi:hypothetical protein
LQDGGGAAEVVDLVEEVRRLRTPPARLTPATLLLDGLTLLLIV